MRVICHIEHSIKGKTPRIVFSRTFFDQNRNTHVNILCYVKITLRSEDRTVAGIWIDQSQVTSREYNTALIFLQVPDVMEEEYKFSALPHRFSMTSKGEQTKLVPAIHIYKDSSSIIKIVKTDQGV